MSFKQEIVEALQSGKDHRVLLDMLRRHEPTIKGPQGAYDVLHEIWAEFGFDDKDGGSVQDELEYVKERAWFGDELTELGRWHARVCDLGRALKNGDHFLECGTLDELHDLLDFHGQPFEEWAATLAGRHCSQAEKRIRRQLGAAVYSLYYASGENGEEKRACALELLGEVAMMLESEIDRVNRERDLAPLGSG